MTPPDASPDAARADEQRRTLEEMENHLLQMRPGVVQSQDGMLYLVAAGLDTAELSTTVYPRTGPLNMLPVFAEDPALVDQNIAAALDRIETHQHTGYGLQTIIDKDGQAVLCRANPIGFSPLYDWQVNWLGASQQWRVSAGKVTSSFYQQYKKIPTPITYVTGSKGWIVLPLTITTKVNLTNPGTLPDAVGSPIFTSTPQQSPPKKSLDQDGAEHWTAGTYQFPLAYVEAPAGAGSAPLIIPYLRSSLSFPNPAWSGGSFSPYHGSALSE
jgi:hypothetical protein